MNISNVLKNNEIAVYIYDTFRKNYLKYFITNSKKVEKRFKEKLGRELNLQQPVYYNDKLQWLKLNWKSELATQGADKYEVRELIKKTIGEKYLNELYGVYESVADIDISLLPKSFVLKGTHGSGYNIICKDKNKMNWDKQFKKMRRWLRTNYYWSSREWVYKDIKPRIICEKYMEELEEGDLKDYKIFCFHGEPKIIQVDFDRFNNHRRNIYDLDWNLRNVQIEYPSDKDTIIEKPKELEKMLELSKSLSKFFPHVRVDFYNVEGRIIFGELTFYHESGIGKFNPPEFEIEMGSYLNLPL